MNVFRSKVFEKLSCRLITVQIEFSYTTKLRKASEGIILGAENALRIGVSLFLVLVDVFHLLYESMQN